MLVLIAIVVIMISHKQIMFYKHLILLSHPPGGGQDTLLNKEVVT